MEEKLDLRIRKTYLALHNAFNTLLEEKRFEDVTINELCDRAMIRRTTFYKHFADKYEYFAFYIREIVLTFQDQLDPAVTVDEANVYLQHMCREMVRFIKKHERLVENIKNSSMFPMLLNILLDQISLDVTAILLHANQDKIDKKQLEGIAAFYAGGLTNTMFQLMKKDVTIDEDQLIGIISKFMNITPHL